MYIMEQIKIPKDCLLCDSCNKQLSDETFIANDSCVWYQSDLICEECDHRYEYGKMNIPVIMNIQKGQDLSKTDLALPMIMEFD